MEITKLHEDIIQTHILTRLDGRSLTAAGCTSSHLQSLCSDHKLWSNICHSTWPSTLDPLVNKAISTFTSGHRSFFSDAFSSPSDHLITAASASPPPPTTQLISTVDLKYNNQLLFSKVVSTNTTPSHGFSSYIFRVDAMGQKEVVRSESIKLSGDDRVMELDLMKHMSLSWIVIDPGMNRAVNLSSLNPVSVTRNWFTDEYELVFAVVTTVDDDEYDYVNCNIEITCGVKDVSLELYVSGVSLTVQDIDGRCLNGKDSMVILHGLMAAKRRRCDGGERRKERFDEYIVRRKERKEMVERRERRLDLVRVGCGVAFMMAFWSFALL